MHTHMYTHTHTHTHTHIYTHTHHCTGPSWLKNLYFVYLVVLRAITKAEPYWIKSTFYTGDPVQERELKEDIMEIVQAAK